MILYLIVVGGQEKKPYDIIFEMTTHVEGDDISYVIFPSLKNQDSHMLRITNVYVEHLQKNINGVYHCLPTISFLFCVKNTHI